jgi:hypothetical protein
MTRRRYHPLGQGWLPGKYHGSSASPESADDAASPTGNSVLPPGRPDEPGFGQVAEPLRRRRPEGRDHLALASPGRAPRDLHVSPQGAVVLLRLDVPLLSEGEGRAVISRSSQARPTSDGAERRPPAISGKERAGRGSRRNARKPGSSSRFETRSRERTRPTGTACGTGGSSGRSRKRSTRNGRAAGRPGTCAEGLTTRPAGSMPPRSSDISRSFRGRVHVLVFEELLAAPSDELRNLFRFLGVAPEPAVAIQATAHNPFALPRSRMAAGVLRSSRARKLARAVVPLRSRRRVERLSTRRLPALRWRSACDGVWPRSTSPSVRGSSGFSVARFLGNRPVSDATCQPPRCLRKSNAVWYRAGCSITDTSSASCCHFRSRYSRR